MKNMASMLEMRAHRTTAYLCLALWARQCSSTTAL